MFKSFKLCAVLVILTGFELTTLAPPTAASHAPPPSGGSGKSCSKFKKGSKGWKECMDQHIESREDAYALGYWLAKTGAYQEALDVLRVLNAGDDPRVLTMIGFATRHLGRVDEALGYYHQALALNANLTNTRQYLGEAYLQQGKPNLARDQLAEIGARCGEGCDDYRKLAEAIKAFDDGAIKG